MKVGAHVAGVVQAGLYTIENLCAVLVQLLRHIDCTIFGETGSEFEGSLPLSQTIC